MIKINDYLFNEIMLRLDIFKKKKETD